MGIAGQTAGAPQRRAGAPLASSRARNAEVRPPRFFVPVALLLGLLGLSPVGEAADLDAAERLVASGAPGLALSVLAEQPPKAGAPAWSRWARLRLRALEAQGRAGDARSLLEDLLAEQGAFSKRAEAEGMLKELAGRP